MGINSLKNIIVCIPEDYLNLSAAAGNLMIALLNHLGTFADEETKSIPHEVFNIVIAKTKRQNTDKSIQSVKVNYCFIDVFFQN